MHKTAHVPNSLPKSVQPKAKSALHELGMAPTRVEAERAFKPCVVTSQAPYPKATQWLGQDRDRLLTGYDVPAEQWVHRRTPHPMESPLATIRHRTKGGVSRATMLALRYKLGLSAEKRWQRLRGFEPLAKVIAGVRFTDGVEEFTPCEEQAQRSSRAAA